MKLSTNIPGPIREPYKNKLIGYYIVSWHLGPYIFIAKLGLGNEVHYLCSCNPLKERKKEKNLNIHVYWTRLHIPILQIIFKPS